MRIEGHQTYAADREMLWSLLHDPNALARVLPGCESLETRGPHGFWGMFVVRMGQTMETFSGVLSLERSVPLESWEFTARGSNLDGAIACRGHVLLSDEGPGLTTLTYVTDIEVSGRPAQLTQRMLQTTARSFARRSLEGLQQQIDARTRGYTPAVKSDGGTRGASSPLALERLVLRRRLILIALVLLAALFFWRRAGNRRERLVAGQLAELLDGAGLASSVPAEPSPALLRVVA